MKIIVEDVEDVEQEAQEEEAPEESATEAVDEGGDEEGEDEIVVQIGDEAEEDEDEFFEDAGEKKPAPNWLKDLRKSNREQAKRIKELEAEKSTPKHVEDEEELPPEPTLEQHDYDAEAFKAALLEWADKKRKVEARKDEKANAQKDAEDAWQAKLSGYAEKKHALKVPDFDGAESYVKDTFDVTQQGIIIEIADDPALLTYALGKNKKRAGELASIKQPVQFIKALTLMEAQIKMTSRKGPPPPERPLSGRTGGGADNTLEKLREEAARTGDMSKVLAYKRKQRS